MKFDLVKQLGIVTILCFVLFTCVSAKRCQNKKQRELCLTSIHLIGRNGFAETISNKERLRQFQSVNFLEKQSYQKVLRIYERDSKGSIRSIVTTYYENGNPKQFLEIINGRAYGIYREWHENSEMSLCAKVIGGTADVTPLAERSWLFDGTSCAWNEEGCLLAEINYCQGSLEGESVYYHTIENAKFDPNCEKQIWKRIPYSKNQIHGAVEIFKSSGELLQEMNYCQGKKQGYQFRYWNAEQPANQEEYSHDKLKNGKYFNQQGDLIAEVVDGTGYRAIFGKESIQELQEILNGDLEGEVKVFNSSGRLKRIYHVKDGIKHGEEIEYYDKPTKYLQPRISFYWYEGKIQGEVKSWYVNGNMESLKEMANNYKNGLLTAWYSDGQLMLIEEYENNKLIKGDYFKKGERFPISQVIQEKGAKGKGTATIFDANGNFKQKISYVNGQPDLLTGS